MMKKIIQSRVMMGLLFLGVFTFFLYVANLVVYEALAGILGLSSPRELFVLALMLGVLSGSFLVSTLLGMRFYNVFTRAYYLLASMWIGIFTYLFMTSVIYGVWVLCGLPYANEVGFALMCVAIIMSTYGLIHARHISIARVDVSLPLLPLQWKGRHAVWISDIHLGQIYGPRFAQKIVRMVNELPHDIVFIGGDLYDGTGAPDIKELVAPLSQCSGKLGIYFITGNHEEFGHGDAFIDAVRSVGIVPLIDEKVFVDGLQIIGIDYMNGAVRSSLRDTLASLSIDRSLPSILLKHEPKDLDIAADAGVSLHISGHTHRAQMWPLGFIAHAIYKGYSYGLKRFGDMQVYTSSGVGTWGPPMRVGTDCEIVYITFS